MIIVFSRRSIESPCGLLHARKDHPLPGVGGLLLRPDVPVSILRSLIGPRFLKPRMLDGGVVHYEVQNDSDPALPSCLRELDEVAQRPEPRINGIVIANVIPV